MSAAARRFWAKVDKTAGPDGCWRWLGGRQSRGYGTATILGEATLAHRYAYEAHRGAIPEEWDGTKWHLHHRCHDRLCVNPWHLEPILPVDHMRVHGAIW